MTGPEYLYQKLKSLGLIKNYIHLEYEPVKPEVEISEIPEPEKPAETPELAIKHKKEHENWVNSLAPKNKQDYLKIFGS